MTNPFDDDRFTYRAEIEQLKAENAALTAQVAEARKQATLARLKHGTLAAYLERIAPIARFGLIAARNQGRQEVLDWTYILDEWPATKPRQSEGE